MTLLQILALLLLPGAWAQGSSSGLGVVLEAKNITLAAGSTAVLACHSPRMVWTRDRLKDRQRVVHWDLVRSSPEYSTERILDMSPGGHQRVYNSFNKGRISIPDSAFNDGNFSLVINNVGAADKGVYTCNLHHHYCQVHQSIQIQLNVTKSVRKERRYWDGEKTVFVVLLGSSIALPCVNRRPLWREGLLEDQQQVAHWDFQAPGVRPDKAERLVDLYASGERRDYGPLFGQKMSVAEDAFTLGDFSLSISGLELRDKGLYSCNLHHHYCGLQERRIFRLTVGPALPSSPSTAPRTSQNDGPEPNSGRRMFNSCTEEDRYICVTSGPAGALKSNVKRRDEGTEDQENPRVVNVILPDHRGYFVQHLGYFLATFLLLAFVVVALIVLIRRHRKRGMDYELRSYDRGAVGVSEGETCLDCIELKTCNQEPLNTGYKNNLLKERGMAKDCNMGLDAKLWK